jgi:phage shock protein PspC (stress-responsive transcriptional regulator)
MLLQVNNKGENRMEATNKTAQSNSLEGARAWFAERGLSRRREDRVLAGVAGAFARQYEVNPFAMRVFAVAGVLLTTPLTYIALWVLMPKAD